MSKINKIFWIDSTGNYQDIEKIFSTNYQKEIKFFPFKNVIKAFEEIVKINFEVIFVILKEDLYKEYYSTFNYTKPTLTCFPISIIYTSNNNLIDSSSNILSGFIGIITSREKLIYFIHDFIKSVNNKIKLNPQIKITIDYNNTLTFEKIKSKDDLVIPSLYVLYKKLECKEIIINDEDIYKFNNILVNNHFDDDISQLIIPLNNVKKLPLEIVSKFWIRYYTSQSSFYPYMNTQLMKNLHENYEIFVRAMYKGIEKSYLQSEYSVPLYRCQLISKAEINMLEKNLILVYSRAFLSFSKDINRSTVFLKKGNNNLIPVMFIVNKFNLEESFSSNASIEQFSFFNLEKEVLFFPFSSFIIDEKIDSKVIKSIETKIIYLNYLGKYRKEIENKINTLDENKIKELLSKDSKFVKDISSIKLNENKIENNQIENQIEKKEIEKIQIELNKSIQKAVKKVKEETLIRWDIEKKNNNCEVINPFQILGISEKENHPEYEKKEIFRTKIKNYKQYLSCFISDNKDKYSRIGNYFLVEKDSFYYVIMNDLQNLKKSYESNKYILAEKDDTRRSLLHYSVIGGYYEITEFLLKIGINYDEPDSDHNSALYYADGKIKELLKKFGSRIERYNGLNDLKGINTVKSNDINIIDSLYKELYNKGLVEKMLDITLDNKVIGKRLYRNKSLIESREKYINWKRVYHGTRFTSIEFILLHGLRNLSSQMNSHIPLGMKIDGIDDWASAIFVTPSIFYAIEYSELINYKNEEWFIIIDAQVKPGSFSVHPSTVYGYKFRNGEPKNVEFRIECYFDGQESSNVIVTSLLFVNKKFIDNEKSFSEGFIFESY